MNELSRTTRYTVTKVAVSGFYLGHYDDYNGETFSEPLLIYGHLSGQSVWGRFSWPNATVYLSLIPAGEPVQVGTAPPA